MHVTVRTASTVDATALAGLRVRARSESGAARGSDPDGFVDALSAWMSTHLSTHRPFVAEVDGRIVGMAWLVVVERVPSPERRRRRSGDVQSVYVRPELRNRGVGAALLDAVLAEARSLGLEHVTVHSSEGAVSLYRRAGFEAAETWLGRTEDGASTG